MVTDDAEAPRSTSNTSLLQIFSGGGMLFVVTFVGLLMSFVCKLLIARVGTQAQYGTFSLGISLLAIGGTLSTVGLGIGLSRSIAAARARAEHEKISEYIWASTALVAVISIGLATLLFVASDGL